MGVESTAYAILRHPVTSIILTVLAISTAVFVGFIFEVGLEFIPLIDKADLIATAFTYAGIVGVFFRVLSLQFTAVANGGWLAPGSVGSKEEAPDNGRLLGGPRYWVSVVLMFSCLFGLLAWLFFAAWAGGMPAHEQFFPIFAVTATAVTYYSWLTKRTYGVFAFGSVAVLMAAMFVGSVWAMYLRESAPHLVVTLRSNIEEPIEFGMLMKASEGIIGHIDRHPTASYLPWNDILRIDSSQRVIWTETTDR